MQEPQPETQSSYKKRPVWQWIAIYAVIGLVVYGLIYYFVLAKKGNNPYSQTTQNTNTEKAQTPTSVPTTAGNQEIQGGIVLTKTGFSPQTITVPAGTQVSWINRSGRTATVNSADHPTHLKYPALNLGEFEDGQSLSLVFDTPGTYKYHNHLDASQFGTVEVQ